MYLVCAMGVTVGFHRHLTHRSFKAKKPVRAALTAAGSIAIEGPVISWVADHRKHHAFSDQEGDPHSPHVGHGSGWSGAIRGLFHAHVGWLFIHTQRGKRDRYAPDLIADPTISFFDRTFLFWVFAGLALPFGLGYLIGGTLMTALTGLLWGGGVRMLVVHHVTYSINSLCHFFGRKDFETGDESRNLAWLSLFTFGESWHNNHHAFPTSARHGLRTWQVDPSWIVIRGLEVTGSPGTSCGSTSAGRSARRALPTPSRAPYSEGISTHIATYGERRERDRARNGDHSRQEWVDREAASERTADAGDYPVAHALREAPPPRTRRGHRLSC